MQITRAVVGMFLLSLSVPSASAQVDFRRNKATNEAAEAPPPAVQRRADDLTVEQPHEEQLVEENPRCQQYANRAADQYRLATTHPGCTVAVDDRWHGEVRRHYRWCLRAGDDRCDAEQRARDDHLTRCGAQRQ
jgi:hypothetical protein